MNGCFPAGKGLKGGLIVVDRRAEGLKHQLDKLRTEKRILREKIAGLKKQHQETLKTLKEGWRLLEALPGGVVLIQDEKIGYINEAARRALGYEKEDVIGHDFAEFVHPEFQSKLRDRYRKRVSGKPVPSHYETCIRNRSGDFLWCEVWIKKKGRRAILLNLHGIDERKEAEKLRIAKEKQETVARISKGLHRDMGAWLLSCARENAGSGFREDPAGKHGSTVKEDCSRPLAENLTLLQELEWLSGNDKERKEASTFDLRKIAQDVVANARKRWRKKLPENENNIRIRSYLRSLPTLEGRPEEIRYALGALVQNAVEALPGGGNIYLSTEESEGFAYLYIQDSGSGIPREIADRIFDPFFSTKGKERRGQGLSLARAIIRRNGGEVDLRSSNGGGTICTVRMPIPTASVPKKKSARRVLLKDTPILVISARDILRDLLCRWFLSRGCRVDAAVTWGEGFQLARKKTYDLMVLDREEIARRDLEAFLKKARRVRPKTPIVLMGNFEANDISKFEKPETGLFLLEKPLNMERAHSIFMEALRRRSSL